jgi:hypothetical protein
MYNFQSNMANPFNFGNNMMGTMGSMSNMGLQQDLMERESNRKVSISFPQFSN